MSTIVRAFKGLLFLLIITVTAHAQAVTGIITDLNGYWKSSTGNLNPIKPANSHNLLAFSYNGTQYSTGVNNELLSNQGESFVACDFWSLPVAAISGTINGNTKAGLGALYDGVANGASNPAPDNNIPFYLTDGTKGLNIGTCVANLPVGTMDFFASSIDANSIGDGIPDIVVTQVADPSSGSFDRYEFINNSGTRVGSYKDIVFTSITPVGTWTADFYEASQNPMTLATGFTQTDRPIRLWAADLSEFGLTPANIGSISKFRINLCGNSDVAFVAYNSQSFRVTTVLPISLTSFKGTVINNQPKLIWGIKNISDKTIVAIERSSDGRNFKTVGVEAVKNNSSSDHSFVDQTTVAGKYYYRLKLVDENKKIQYSFIIQLSISPNRVFTLYRSSKHSIAINHPPAKEDDRFIIYNASAKKLVAIRPASGAVQTSISIPHLPQGIYIVQWQTKQETFSRKLLID